MKSQFQINGYFGICYHSWVTKGFISLVQRFSLNKESLLQTFPTDWLVKETCAELHDLVTFVQFKIRENTHGGVLILVKLQAEAFNFIKINTPPWVFFTFLKLYKWYQIEQRTTLIVLWSFYINIMGCIGVTVSWFETFFIISPKAVTQTCSVKKVFLEIL